MVHANQVSQSSVIEMPAVNKAPLIISIITSVLLIIGAISLMAIIFSKIGLNYSCALDILSPKMILPIVLGGVALMSLSVGLLSASISRLNTVSKAGKEIAVEFTLLKRISEEHRQLLDEQLAVIKELKREQLERNEIITKWESRLELMGVNILCKIQEGFAHAIQIGAVADKSGVVVLDMVEIKKELSEALDEVGKFKKSLKEFNKDNSAYILADIRVHISNVVDMIKSTNTEELIVLKEVLRDAIYLIDATVLMAFETNI